MSTATTANLLEPRDFIRQIIADDLAAGTHNGRVVTRFPPEPNGFLHIGHAKAICLNFGIAGEVPGARCHLRFDDTNPETERQEYVESIQDSVRWLGYDWGEHLYFASDYFPRLYEFAEHMVRTGSAYVDSQSEDEIRATRGTISEPGTPSPYRDRDVAENLDLLRRMKAGEFENGAHVLRAKIDMASPNMLMRDPVLYRIRHARHYRTGDEWCIYPLYDYAHALEDAIEDITHSLCTLEFETNRPLYDWVVEHAPVDTRPRQYEFARLNLDYTVMSKRKLLTLVNDGHVAGWDDPRMPTIAGMRRRGYTPESIRSFCDMIGVTKAETRVDIGKLEYAVRDDLNRRVRRVLGVLRPLRVVIANWAGAGAGAGAGELLAAPYYPRDVPLEGTRDVPFDREILIERDDFSEDPPADWHRLSPGAEVRLRYAYFIRCNEVIRDESGDVVELRCTYDPETRGGRAPDGRKPNGTIHWVSASRSLPCTVRLYDRLFTVPDPDAAATDADTDVTAFLNPDSLVTIEDARIEPSVADDPPGTRYQFERLGYFMGDVADSTAGALVFNRTVTLRETWGKRAGAGELRTTRSPAQAPAPAPAPAASAPPSIPERSADLQARRERYEAAGVSAEAAEVITRDDETADFFDAATSAAAAGASAHGVASWLVNELRGARGDRALADLPFAPADFAALVARVEGDAISSSAGRDVLARMVETGGAPDAIIEREGLAQISDDAALLPVIEEVLADNPGKVDEYRNGKTGLLGFFMGQVMRRTSGRANPEVARRLLEDRLGA